MNLYEYYSKPDTLIGYSNRMYLVPRLALTLAIEKDDPKAIEVIKKDPKTAKAYAFTVNRRFEEAEPYILNDPEIAYEYAFTFRDDFPNGRWEDAERVIMKYPNIAVSYAEDVLRYKRWPEAEPYIMKSPKYAYRYAKYILKDRWVEAEPYIKQDPDEWKHYAYRFKLSDKDPLADLEF
jgi:hypothetical protein